MPRLIRFMLSHFANGAVLGLSFGLALLWTDVGEIDRLLAASNNAAALTALFFAQAALLFGTLGMSVAVMNLTPPRR